MTVPSLIIIAFGMLRSIGLDNHPLLKIHEIGNIPVNHHLPFEFVTGKSLVAQDKPEFALGVGGIGAHPFSASEEFLP